MFSLSTPIVFSNQFKILRMPKHADTSDFWKRLVEARKASGHKIDQKSIGKDMGVGQSQVTKYKTGKDTITHERANRLAKISKVSVDYLMTGEHHVYGPPPDDPYLKKVLEIWPHLVQESRAEIASQTAWKRIMQNTAPESRIKEVHKNLPEANRKAKDAAKKAEKSD